MHQRTYAQLGASHRLAFAIGDAHQHDIVKRELALSRRVVDRERQDAAVGQADAPRLALLAGRLLEHDRRRPVHVIERQPCTRQRPLPNRPLVTGFLLRVDALDRLAEIRLSRPKLDAPRAALITRKPFLQSLLYRALQLRIDS